MNIIHRNAHSSRLLAIAALAAALPLIAQNAKAVKASLGAPPNRIPTFSTADLSRTGIYYAGGKYVREGEKATMGGSAYTVVWVPKQIKHPYPIVYIHETG